MIKNSKKVLILSISMIVNNIWAENISFNDLDCTDEEIKTYLDQSEFKKPKGFNTIPSYKEFNDPIVATETIEKGEEAASQGCATIFSEGGFDFDSSNLNLENLTDGISGMIGNIGGSLSGLADSAKNNITKLRESYTEVLQESVCERLKPENFQETIYEQVENAYKDITSSTILNGTASTSDPESFLRRIIQNQISRGNSTLLNLLDIAQGDADFEDVLVNLLGDALSSELDDLEDQIFGI